MNQTSNIQRCAAGGIRLVAWACLTLCLGIVIAAGGIAAVTATRPVATFEPVVVLRWDDVR